MILDMLVSVRDFFTNLAFNIRKSVLSIVGLITGLITGLCGIILLFFHSTPFQLWLAGSVTILGVTIFITAFINLRIAFTFFKQIRDNMRSK